MKCAASKFEVDLMPDHSVQIVLRCRCAYEAAILFDEISDKIKAGSLVLEVGTTKVERRIR